MLEDLNKTVPELDEYDSNKMYNNISNKMNKKSKKPFNRGFILGIASIAFLLAIIIPVGIIINKNVTNNRNNKEIIDYELEYIEVSGYIGTEDMLGVAAYKPFDDKNNNTKSKNRFNPLINNEADETVLNNSTNENNDSNKFSYPFDYVRITSAEKFSITVDDLSYDEGVKDAIENSCGIGDLEVVVAKFSAYYVVNKELRELVSDELVSIRGYNGYYTILMNSGSYKYGETIKTYSSHKTITNNAIEKDFTGTIVTIFVKQYSNKKYVSFKSDDGILSTYDYDSTHQFEASNTIKANTSELYSILNLNTFITAKLECVVKEIDIENNKLYVKTSSNKSKIIFLNDELQIDIKNIKIDDIIIVEYLYLYEGYNPTSIHPNKVSLK